jgi:hypothetical protein
MGEQLDLKKAISHITARGWQLGQNLIFILQSFFYILVFALIYVLAGVLRRSPVSKPDMEFDASASSKLADNSSPVSEHGGFPESRPPEANQFIADYYNN